MIPRQFDAGKLLAPKSIPKDIAMIKEDELPPPSTRWRGRRLPGALPAARSAA